MAAGTMAGGGGSTNILLDPSAVAGHGLDATQPLAQKIEDLGTFDIADAVVFGISYLLIMLCFLVMAINCFLAVLEYYLIVALVGIFLPFALFPSTKFLAERAIGAVVAVGMKLMTLAFVMAVVEPTLGNIHFASDEIAMNELFAVLLTAAGCTFLSWQAPRLASGLMSGSPHLGAGDVAQHATAAAGVAGALGGAVGGFAATRAAAAPSEGPRGPSATAAASGTASTLSGTSSSIAARTPSAVAAEGALAASATPARANPSLVKSITRVPPPVSPSPVAAQPALS
jgi:type IV secretion system protein TrbL